MLRLRGGRSIPVNAATDRAMITPFVTTLMFANAMATVCVLPWGAFITAVGRMSIKKASSGLLTRDDPIPSRFPSRARGGGYDRVLLRRKKGRFTKQQASVGRPARTDRRTKAKRKVKKGKGDRGDVRARNGFEAASGTSRFLAP